MCCLCFSFFPIHYRSPNNCNYFQFFQNRPQKYSFALCYKPEKNAMKPNVRECVFVWKHVILCDGHQYGHKANTIKEKIANARRCECLKWKDVYNNVPDIHSTEIIDQPIHTHTHTHIHTQIHRALACLHLSSFFDLTYNMHSVLDTKAWRSNTYGEKRTFTWRRAREQARERWIHARIMSSVDSLVCSIFYCWNDFCEARFFGMTKI